MKRKWKKWVKGVCWVLLTPILLFVILMALLYIPSVQNFLRREVTEYASQATGMQIQVERIDLRFPLNLLISGVEVIQQPDTLFTLESLNVHIQALPLIRGQVEVDDITLTNVSINSADLLEGMQVKGTLGRFFLNSHGVDLLDETVIINNVELSDTYVQVLMNDTTTAEPEDSIASEPMNWKIDLRRMKLSNVTFDMDLPLDSMRMSAYVGDAEVDRVQADLEKQSYGIEKFRLKGTSVKYDTGVTGPTAGFDASHIALRDINIGLDSLLYNGREMNAVISELTMSERSGLSITSFTGKLFSNDSIISIPELKLQTPYSEIDLSAHTYWELVDIPTTGHLSLLLNAYIGKEDVMLFAADLPESFKEAYPYRPLVVRAGTEGNLKELQLSRFKVDLPGAFSIDGGGIVENLTDSLKRIGNFDLNMSTQDMNFLTALAGEAPDETLVIPDSMNLTMRINMEGAQYEAKLDLQEHEGTIGLEASVNTLTEAYGAALNIDNLQLQHFLPQDSLYELSLSLTAKGQKFDVMSVGSKAEFDVTLGQCHYANYRLSDVGVKGNLTDGLVTVDLSSNNALLRMKANGEYNLVKDYPDGKLAMNVAQLDLYELGIVPEPMEGELAFNLTAEARRDLVTVNMSAGDMTMEMKVNSGVYPLMDQSLHFMDVVMKQLDNRELNHAELRQALPTALISFSAGQDNPLSHLLATQHITYHDAAIQFATGPDWGINGRAAVHLLKMDSLQLDTVFFDIHQDTTIMRFKAGVANAPDNPQVCFSSKVVGEIRDKDAEIVIDFIDDKGETGLLFGLDARPLFEGNGQGNGLALSMVPEEPIIAYRKFRFKEKHNWIYLHRDMHVYANVDMWDDEGMGFHIHSSAKDTTSLQNIDVEIHEFKIDDLTSMIPYLPDITGLFSVEAHYIQTEKSLELSAEASIDELTYEKQRIGDIVLGLTWLPDEQGKQYVDMFMSHDDVEVLTASGKTMPTQAETDSLKLALEIKHFPLSIANGFIPDQIISLSGELNGNLSADGYLEQPIINGQLALDEVNIFSSQFGISLTTDNRPIQLIDNQLEFDKFAIYAMGNDPFTIDGYVDFRDLSNPMVNLNLLAENYVLMDSKRTRESIVYGKICTDLKALVKGPLNELTMRGNLNLLGSTDVSYVLTDSPLTVQDRLGSLVEFTSFADTTAFDTQDISTVSLGGLDMVMMIHIDPAVRVKVDLDAGNDNRVEIEGGGDLSLKYTPQGDLLLTGRYTLTGGLMKYSLPLIAVKEFDIDNGSYVEWTGDLMDPSLDFKATDRIKATVSDGEGGTTRSVNFDVSVVVKNRLEDLSFAFDVEAPEDATIQNELSSMDAEERGKQALYIMMLKTYLGTGGGSGGLGNLTDMGAALNSVLSSQINELMGNIKGASLSVGIDDYDDTDAGGKRTDYSFSYSQRFFNNRFQIVIGGKVSQGENVTNSAESFIDNISLEYRLDSSGTRYVRLFYDKNYESVLEGEITETGVGVVLRKNLDKLSELFIFKRKKKEKE